MISLTSLHNSPAIPRHELNPPDGHGVFSREQEVDHGTEILV
jgi:hypothetical protein